MKSVLALEGSHHRLIIIHTIYLPHVIFGAVGISFNSDLRITKHPFKRFHFICVVKFGINCMCIFHVEVYNYIMELKKCFTRQLVQKIAKVPVQYTFY